MAVVFIVLSVLICLFIGVLPIFLQKMQGKRPWRHLPVEFSRRSILVCAAIIFVCWIPWIIVQYPCSMNGDTYNQLYQFQTASPTFYSTIGTYVDAEYIDHHPLFDTLLFGCFLWLGQQVGSQNVGLFVYSVLQSACTALALALGCCYLEKLQVPKVLRIAALLFCALFPVYPQWTTDMIKDSLFSLCFVPYFVCYIEIFRTKGRALGGKRFLVWFMVCVCLCILTKKSGVYIVGLSGVVMALVYRTYWKRAVLSVIAPIMLALVLVPALVWPAVGGVAPGGKQEMLGVFLQQTVTVLVEGDDDLSEDERAAIDSVLDTDAAMEVYRDDLVDPVKNGFNQDATSADIVRFFQSWATIGIRHPGEYALSLARINGPLIGPVRPISYYETCTQDETWVQAFDEAAGEGGARLTFHKPSAIESLSQKIQDAYNAICRVPGLNILFSRGLYGGWLPALCLLASMFFQKRYAMAFVPVLASVVFLILSPAASPRYVLPLLYIAPLMCGLLGHACLSAVQGDTAKHGKHEGTSAKQ